MCLNDGSGDDQTHAHSLQQQRQHQSLPADLRRVACHEIRAGHAKQHTGQDQTERACSNGGWLVPDRWCYAGGPIYATALNVLTLEVYYRYANAFGASMAAKKPGKPDSKVEGGPGDRTETKQDTK